MTVRIGVFFALCRIAWATKGVPADRQTLYQGKSTFDCRDGSKSIAISLVNDDYCDCFDGSDEPGTAACSGGTFFCVNSEHVGEKIYSSRVNDGVCDCCDGSDEDNPFKTCPDTCRQVAAAAAAAAAALQKITEEGLAKKSVLIELARTGLQAKKFEKEKAEEILSQKEGAISKHLAHKEAMEILEKEEKQAYKHRLDREKFQHLGLLELSENQLRELVMNVARQGNNSELVLETSNELRVNAGLPVVDPISSLRKAREMEKEQQIEKESSESLPETSTEPIEKESSESLPESETNGDADTETEAEAEAKVEVEAETDLDLLKELLGDGVYTFEHKRAMEARTAYEEAETQRDAAKNERDAAEKELEADYGPDNVHWPMKGKCFELVAGQYTYKMCPYANAKQDHTSLGDWKGFNSDYTSMEFSGGQHCWNGPNRSCKVLLECGTEEKIQGIDEISTCVYEMVFSTPAACTGKLTTNEREEL